MEKGKELTHEHLTPDELRRFLCETDQAWQRRLVLHLLTVCPVCGRVGAEILEAYERGDFGLEDPMMTIDTAILEHRARRELPVVLAGGEESAGNGVASNAWGWTVVLSRESHRLTPEDPEQALEYARVALCSAYCLDDEWPASQDWNRALTAFVWAVAGNAARVLERPAEAAEAFELARRFLEGKYDAGGELPYKARTCALLASYARYRGAYFEALDHLDGAICWAAMIEVRPDLEYGAFLLVKKALLQTDMGDAEAALTSLEEAERALEGLEPSRLHACVAGNRLASLIQLQDVEEAFPALVVAREVNERCGTAVDQLHVDWQEGLLLRLIGDYPAAAALLERTFHAFADQRLGLSTALVLLDLAQVHLLAERPDRVRELALAAIPLLQAQGLHREQLACLRLFFLAAEKETLEVAVLQELSSALQHLPEGHPPKKDKEKAN